MPETCYELITEIGQTALGGVHVAKAVAGTLAGRPVLLRTVSTDDGVDEEILGALHRAATRALAIRNSRVVGLLDVHPGSRLLIVTEYVEGVPLRELLRGLCAHGSPLPVPVALRICVDVLQGVAAARRTLRRAGIKNPLLGLGPDCLLLASFGETLIADLGVALLGPVPWRGELIAYRSPEQLAGERAGPAAEVFAAGALLAELLLNRPLFSGDDPEAVVEQVSNGQLPPFARADAELAQLVDRALRVDPGERFADVDVLASALMSLGERRIASNEAVAVILDRMLGRVMGVRRQLIDEALGSPGEELLPPPSDRPTLRPVANPGHSPQSSLRALHQAQMSASVVVPATAPPKALEWTAPEASVVLAEGMELDEDSEDPRRRRTAAGVRRSAAVARPFADAKTELSLRERDFRTLPPTRVVKRPRRGAAVVLGGLGGAILGLGALVAANVDWRGDGGVATSAPKPPVLASARSALPDLEPESREKRPAPALSRDVDPPERALLAPPNAGQGFPEGFAPHPRTSPWWSRRTEAARARAPSASPAGSPASASATRSAQELFGDPYGDRLGATKGSGVE